MGVLLWPEGKAIPRKYIPPEHTVEDLQLEALADAMSFNHYFRLSVADLLKLWTDDPETIVWRQAVLKDLMQAPEFCSAIEELLDNIDTWETRSGRSARSGGEMGRGGPQPLDLYDFSFLESYLQRLSEMDRMLGEMEIGSEGMRLLRQEIHASCDAGAFARAREAFEKDCRGYTLPSKVTLGFNLSNDLKPVNLKLLRVPERTEKQAKEARGKRISLTPQALQSVSQVLSTAVAETGMAISGFVRRESAPLRNLKQDFIFYLSAIHLMKSWDARGLKYCFPELRPAGEGAFRAAGMFNPMLVISGSEKIISNSVEFCEGGELLVLTGANQGGKTVFLLSCALTQWLFQLGFPAPCESAALSPAEQILTVFAPNAALVARNRGLLSEEAGRIAEAANTLSENCFVLFNEPLNATSPAENLDISREVLAVFKAAGARGVWVTHLYELASDRERLNTLLPWGSRLGSIRIVVETDEKGTHSTYHVERGEPEFNSYASEVMRRKGLDLGL